MIQYQLDGMKRKLLATVVMAGLLGACSSDITRFDDDPFQNPFRSRTAFDPVNTNSINRTNGNAQSPRPLEPVGNGSATTQALPPPNQPVLGANPAARGTLTTGSVASANYPQLAGNPAPQSTVIGNNAGWTAVGGTPVTLQQGESLNTLASRYNVPVSAIMAVNGISSVNQTRPGQQVMIPAYNAVAASKAAAHSPGASAIIQRPQPQPVMQSLPKPSPQSAAILPPRPVKLEPAKVEPIRVAAKARNVAAPIESDAEKRAAAKLREMKAPKPQADSATEKRAEAKKAEAIARAEATKTRLEAEKAKAAQLAATRRAKAEDDRLTTASVPEVRAFAKAEPEKEPAAPSANGENASFRWPAKGRVISGFGARGTSGVNDGINIALPEGTPVRAAESGTVVHADDALKGYGKLVLIRHPNGYVSVYAHNGELNVKRGESVKRGQVIAKSGQTGNVTAPQLHFEIRKGATPIDPMKQLGE